MCVHIKYCIHKLNSDRFRNKKNVLENFAAYIEVGQLNNAKADSVYNCFIDSEYLTNTNVQLHSVVILKFSCLPR